MPATAANALQREDRGDTHARDEHERRDLDGRDVTLDLRSRLLGKRRARLVAKRSTLNEPMRGEGYR